MELLGALQAKKLTKEKWKQYCGTPCATTFKIVVYYNYLSGIFRSKHECKLQLPQIRRKLNFDHYSDLRMKQILGHMIIF